jgi:hypothetical protein
MVCIPSDRTPTHPGKMLPWAVEKVAQVEEQAALEKQRADEAQLKVERLAELLRSQGIDPGVL